MQIEQATIENSADIAKLHVSSWLAAYKDIVPAHVLEKQSAESQEEFWKKVLRKKPENVLVAVSDTAEIIGFITFGPSQNDSRVGEVHAIYARPDYFRSGVGRLMWESARQRLIRNGFQKIIAFVIRTNYPARRFYENVGFNLVPDSASTFTWEGEELDDVCYEYIVS